MSAGGAEESASGPSDAAISPSTVDPSRTRPSAVAPSRLEPSGLAIGVDLGGTKIEAVALDREGRAAAGKRVPSPQGNYDATIAAIADLVAAIEHLSGWQGGDGGAARPTVGIGIPGSISPRTGAVQNANSTWLNGRALSVDLAAALGRPLRIANDANCFALSEAADGAAAGARSVFGVIIGTGCGGGLVHEGRLIDGPRGIGGEWGHNPLPWAEPDERPGPACWCGRSGCMETWVSGPALAADHTRATGQRLDARSIGQRAEAGDADTRHTLNRHAGRLARGIAHVVNMFDPEVVVLGGGLSQIEALYARLPDLIAPHVFADDAAVVVRPPRWGDASGVRGAARLWMLPPRGQTVVTGG